MGLLSGSLPSQGGVEVDPSEGAPSFRRGALLELPEELARLNLGFVRFDRGRFVEAELAGKVEGLLDGVLGVGRDRGRGPP